MKEVQNKGINRAHVRSVQIRQWVFKAAIGSCLGELPVEDFFCKLGLHWSCTALSSTSLGCDQVQLWALYSVVS